MMKAPLIIILLFTVLFVRCTSNDEKVIGDYVQKIDGVKTDLEFKLIKVDKVREVIVTGKDSVKYYEGNLEDYKKRLKEYENDIIETKKKYPNSDVDQVLKESYKDLIEFVNKRIIKDSLSVIRFNKIPEEKICIKKVVTYSVINPALNNVRQEFTKHFVFSIDEKEILREW